MTTLDQIQQIKSSVSPWNLNSDAYLQKKQPLDQPMIESDRFLPFPLSLNQKLNLLIRQIQLHLPVEPLLEAEPELAQLADEVLSNVPKILHPQHPIQLHQPLVVRLTSETVQTCIEVNVNQGQHKGSHPKLFEWGVRSPNLGWRDEVKLWAATKHLQCDPDHLYLTVLALRLDDIPQAQLHRWSIEQQQATETWLLEMFEKAYNLSHTPAPSTTETSGLPDKTMTVAEYLETIPEVPL
ncbi:hypothetical protein [Leptolyngbya sp. AN10]